MASLDFFRARYYAAKGVIGQVADDGGIAIRLKYIGTGSVTSVTVTTATNIVTVTTEGTKTYTFATYTTVGALVAAINKDGIFQARALDASVSSATASAFIDGAITVSGGYFDVKSDTSGALFLGYCLSYDRNVGVNEKLVQNHRVHIQSLVTNVTLGGGADANGLKVYERNPLNGVETLLYQATPTSGSSATITWASGAGKISSSEGMELLVVVVDATSVTGSLTVSGISE